MAAKKKKTSLKDKVKEKVKKKVEQVKEPFTLLETLKDEGMASAVSLLTMASHLGSSAMKNIKSENLKPALRELIVSLGFAFREDLERLEARLEELEDRLTELESEKLRAEDEE